MWVEESLNYRFFDDLKERETEAFIENSVKTALEHSYENPAVFKSWINRLGKRQAPQAWKDNEKLSSLWVVAHKSEILNGTINFPPGLDISNVPWIFEKFEEKKRYNLYLKESDIVFNGKRSIKPIFKKAGAPIIMQAI